MKCYVLPGGVDVVAGVDVGDDGEVEVGVSLRVAGTLSWPCMEVDESGGDSDSSLMGSISDLSPIVSCNSHHNTSCKVWKKVFATFITSSDAMKATLLLSCIKLRLMPFKVGQAV